MCLMPFWSAVEDQDVIQINKDRVAVEVLQHIIHQGLEDGRSIGEPEGHD